VFEPCADGFGVYFPDLPYCTIMGDGFGAAMQNAQEALGLHLWGMLDDEEAIPAPTEPPFADAGAGCIIAAVKPPSAPPGTGAFCSGDHS
jgi:predicted RNase H-like HicB family nuclease